jgi:hypothetical protein
MHVCTMVWGKIASIASGNPFSPSTQQIRMSEDAALEQLGQDLHPELRALGLLNHRPSTSRSPSTVTPKAR